MANLDQMNDLQKEAQNLVIARYNNEPTQNNERLKEIQNKLPAPEIGGFVVVGTESSEDLDMETYVGDGVFASKELALKAAKDFGDLPFKEASKNWDYSGSINHSAEVIPVTKALAALFKKDKAPPPSYLMEMYCTINGEKVASAPFEDGMKAQTTAKPSQIMKKTTFPKP